MQQLVMVMMKRLLTKWQCDEVDANDGMRVIALVAVLHLKTRRKKKSRESPVKLFL
jgi:hypothetical protein